MQTPTWLDKTAYPFTSRYVDLPDGRMHYVDEGSGEVLLMTHGLPAWSFLYRHLITALREDYRVIAIDHLGYGLSDRPADYDYRPATAARNLEAFIQALDLHSLTLVVHDFGGPITLSYAVQHPANIRRLVLFNTWMWSLQDDPSKRLVVGLLGGAVGRFLYNRFNFEANVIMRSAYGDKSKLTRAIHDQYRGPFQHPDTRYAAWRFTQELLKSGEWYDSLWAERAALRDLPALLLWGLRDPVFGKAYLERWQTLFPEARVVTYPKTGHFVQEEQPEVITPIIQTFLQHT
ncbi:MAG: alpha/beta fold hydrolase [Anaerolineales bacterium]